MLRKHVVDVSDDPGFIVVDMDQSVRIFQDRQLQVREINAVGGASGVDVFNDLPGHKVSNIYLGFLGASANMGR